MCRTLLSFFVALSLLAISASSAFAQHRGGGFGGHGGFGGGFGGHGGFHRATMPMSMSRPAFPMYPTMPSMYSYPPVLMAPVVDATPVTVGDTVSEQPASTKAEDSGVMLDEVTRGAPAHVAGLRPGDVIMSFGGVRTHTFAELRSAVQRATGPVRVVFVNGESNAMEYLVVEPVEGRIGIFCITE